jgi:hypothetical protein
MEKDIKEFSRLRVYDYEHLQRSYSTASTLGRLGVALLSVSTALCLLIVLLR